MSDPHQPDLFTPQPIEPASQQPGPHKVPAPRWLLVVRVVLVLILAWYLILLVLPGPNQLAVYDLELVRGTKLSDLADTLVQRGIIRSQFHFKLVARLRGLDRRMQSGDYRLRGTMTAQQLLAKLVSGKVDSCKFTLPEGYSIYQAADLLHRQGLIDRSRFLAAAHDPGLLKQLGITASTVEGYLYPGTYQVRFFMDERQLIERMVAQYRRQLSRLPSLSNPAGLSPHQVLTMASLIEREAVDPTEKRRIASVFYNRLKIGMPLQSDPTAVYGVKNGGKVTKADLAHNSPYNTYKIKGLPPGPIGNPAIATIKAVLEPEQTDFLYFVARKDGTHQFSKSLAEHQRAINRYLK